MNQPAHNLAARARESRSLLLLLRLLFVILASGWLLYLLSGHRMVEAAYNGSSFDFLNRMIEDQHISSLQHYIDKADQLFLLLNVHLIIVSTLGLLLLTRHDVLLGNRITMVILSFVVIVVTLTLKPMARGDAPGYFLVTESFFNHLAPDLRPEDIESIAQLESKFDFPLLNRNVQHDYYFKANDGKLYSIHFWGYSLLNLPAKILLRLSGLNEARTFQITNGLLLLLSLWHVVLLAALTERQKQLFILLLFCSPMLWFVYWPHTEVFSFAFVVMSLVYVSRHNWHGAILCAAIAAVQNPPLILMAGFVWLLGMIHAKSKRKGLLSLSLAALPAFAPYAFSLIKYGVFSLYATKSAGTDILSVPKAFDLFFDLNIGMLPYVPVALLLAWWVWLRDGLLQRRFTLAMQLFVLLMAMMIVCTGSRLWNHGTTGPSRYVIWMLPLVFYVVINDVARVRAVRSVYVSLVWLAILSQLGLVMLGGGFRSSANHTRHTYVAKFVLDHAPALYNPNYEVFDDRTAHRISMVTRSDSLGFFVHDHRTPVVYRRSGECRKAMVRGRDKEALLGLCGSIPVSKQSFFDDEANRDKTIYVNY